MKGIAIAFIIVLTMSCIALADADCDYEASIIANGTDFAREDFQWQMRAVRLQGGPANITGTAEIIDSEGNVVKRYKPWTNEPISKQKTSAKYSPNLKEGAYKIVSEISLSCNDINKNNNVNEKAIRIKNLQDELKINESNNLQQPLPKEMENNASPGQKTGATILNTTKDNNKTINLEQSETKNSTNEEFENEIYLKESNDKKEELMPTAAAAKSGIIYQSSNEKSKSMILFLLLGISILLNIVLIWKR